MHTVKPYTELRKILTEHFGVEIRYAPRTRKSLRRYIRDHGFSGSAAYLEYVKTHLEEELPHLADCGAVHTTALGRDPEFWSTLNREVLIKLERGPYKVLSLGCSTGQELATAALIAYQRFGDLATILAYDISPAAVKAALNPLFQRKLLKRLPGVTAETYGLAVGGGRFVTLVPEVAKLIEAHVGDARTVELPEAHFDLVLCRNLPYYFDAPTVEAFYQRCHKALKPTGYLGIGSIDPIPSKELFASVGNMLYRCILPQR